MRTANRRQKRVSFSATARVSVVALALLLPDEIRTGDSGKVDPRTHLEELARLGARKAFLTDSPDVYLEPRSLNRFFTTAIYRRLHGNAYFGYDYDEGFHFEGKEVQVEVLRDLTAGASFRAAYRLALEQALAAAGLEIKPAAPYQIGLCIVGIEPRQTSKTLPGVMVEAYLRNVQQKKAFFIRYGAGSRHSLAAAIRLSAEMLVSQLEARRTSRKGLGIRQEDRVSPRPIRESQAAEGGRDSSH
jgi:hypothetical protein